MQFEYIQPDLNRRRKGFHLIDSRRTKNKHIKVTAKKNQKKEKLYDLNIFYW